MKQFFAGVVVGLHLAGLFVLLLGLTDLIVGAVSLCLRFFGGN